MNMQKPGRFHGWCRGGLVLSLALVALLIAPTSAPARPAIRSAFFSAYPSAIGTRLDNLASISGHCGVCHYQFTGAGPRNRYGQWVEAALPGYPNTSDGKRLAILSVQGVDSDADGYANLTEITDVVTYVNTPTFPGLVPANVDSVSAVNQNDLLAYLVPATGADTTPPTITLLAPNGGETWNGEAMAAITWTAGDNVGVTGVDLYYRVTDTSAWEPIGLNQPNTGSFAWFALNTPTSTARVRAVARDAAGNTGADMSNGLFTIVRLAGGIAPTTLRDFKQPGTQPLGGGDFVDHTACTSCHGGYNTSVEPGHNWAGSMMAQAGRDPLFFACLAVANQDAPSSGDLCLRCHNSFGWLGGRSTPTTGSQMTSALDRDGVSCDFCHRVVDPIYKPGVSPPEDQSILDALLPSHVPAGYANGQFVVDPVARKRGPYTDAAAPHTFLASAVHLTSDFCGTCHDVSNPVFSRAGGADYAPGPLDQEAGPITSDAFMPLERTYSEWKNSDYVAGVYAPDFAGNKPGGIVSSCQDCHMRSVAGAGCNDPLAPIRQDLPLHDMTGGNTWLPFIIASLNPEVNAAAATAAAGRAQSMLQKAAALNLTYTLAGDSFQAVVTVTNRTGHKLPTGYPEGRRMWLHVLARDAGGAVVYESGAYNPATGVLTHDEDAAIYEAELGISPALGGALGVPHGPSFHFALNDSIYKDNRIPPQGFANAAFAAFGGAPVDPGRPGLVPRYADGQNWDTQTFGLPSEAKSVRVELLYQTTSKEYVEFLRDANTTDASGQTMYDLWSANGRAWPIVMQTDSVGLNVTGVEEEGVTALAPALSVLRNPFGDALNLRVFLPRPTPVRMDVFDVQGRRVRSVDFGPLGAGAHPLSWDGRADAGSTAGAGIYWIRVRAGELKFVRQVVRVK
jgi:hypothetical protein